MRNVTAEELKESAVTKGIESIPVRECSICNSPLCFVVRNTDLYFSSACACSDYRTNPSPREWGDAAAFINSQTSDQVKQKIAALFGVEIGVPDGA